MSRCYQITSPKMTHPIDISNLKGMVGKPYCGGILSTSHLDPDAGYGFILVQGNVWVRRDDLPLIREAGLDFVVIEEGDRLFRRGVFRYIPDRLLEEKHHNSSLVVICLGGRDITEFIEMQDKLDKGEVKVRARTFEESTLSDMLDCEILVREKHAKEIQESK